MKSTSVKQCAAGDGVADRVHGDQLLGLPVGRGEIDFGAGGAGSGVHFRQLADQLVSLADAGLGLGRSGFRASPQPFDLGVHEVRQGILPLSLRVQAFLLGFEERAVASVHAQKAVFVNSIELDDFARDIFQKIAVVADHHASERRILKHRFEPLDSGEIQVVGRLIEQKNVGLLHQRRADRQAFAPASRQCRRGSFKVRKARAAQRLGGPRRPLRFRNGHLLESVFDDRADRGAAARIPKSA